jgi:hypothetical protein
MLTENASKRESFAKAFFVFIEYMSDLVFYDPPSKPITISGAR